jgi:hypothetical protein
VNDGKTQNRLLGVSVTSSEHVEGQGPVTANPGAAAEVASQFHAAYERLAPRFGYSTREASAVPWDEVPQQNRDLMVAVVDELLARGVIVAGGRGSGR